MNAIESIQLLPTTSSTSAPQKSSTPSRKPQKQVQQEQLQLQQQQQQEKKQTFKCCLSTFVRNNLLTIERNLKSKTETITIDLIKEINKKVDLINFLQVKTYQFLNFFALDCLNKGIDIPLLNTDFIKKATHHISSLTKNARETSPNEEEQLAIDSAKQYMEISTDKSSDNTFANLLLAEGICLYDESDEKRPHFENINRNNLKDFISDMCASIETAIINHISDKTTLKRIKLLLRYLEKKNSTNGVIREFFKEKIEKNININDQLSLSDLKNIYIDSQKLKKNTKEEEKKRFNKRIKLLFIILKEIEKINEDIDDNNNNNNNQEQTNNNNQEKTTNNNRKKKKKQNNRKKDRKWLYALPSAYSYKAIRTPQCV